MKKIILLTGLMIFICYSGWTQVSTTTLDFRIVNPRIIYDFNNTMNGGFGGNCENLDFDLEVKADIAGSYLHALELHMTTNMTAVTDLDFILAAGGWTTYYSILTFNLNNNNINLSVANSQGIGSGATARWTQIPTTWKSVGTLRLRILDISLVENCSWLPALMTGVQLEKYFTPTPGVRSYLGFTTVGTPITNLYLGRIYSEGTASWGWSQAGGTVAGSQYLNWTTAVNTSVWDTTSASAYILNAGSQAAALRIHPGARLAIAIAADLTCTGNTEINEPRGLWINSGGSGNGSFIDNGITYPNSGSARVERHLTACDVNLPPLGSEGCWHYVSIPVTSAVAGVFNGDYLKSFDEVTGLWSGYYTHSGTPLNVMEGYAVHRPAANLVDTKLFTGYLNTACPPKPLTRHPGNTPGVWDGTGGWGYNLTGNPYPSSIDLENNTIGWNNVDKKVWYYDKTGATYLVYIVGGVGASGSRYIPPMQGIFVHVNEFQTAGSLTFPNTSRIHSHVISFYKELEAPNDVDVLYLQAQGNVNGSYDLASIVLRDYSTSNYDNEYDASKMYGSLGSPQLYTLATDGSYLTINTLPYAGRNTTVPLNFKVLKNGTGTYTITASNLASFKNGTTIILEDKKETKTQELTVNPVYTFNYTNGDDAARFLLHFYNPFFGINDPGRDNNMLIYSFGHDVYVKDLTGNPEKGDFYLYDMMGKKITQKPVADITLNKYSFNLPDGYYIVRVITKDKTHNCKVYLD